MSYGVTQVASKGGWLRTTSLMVSTGGQKVQVPQAMWDEWTPRDDHAIGLQEFMSMILALDMFQQQLRGCLVTVHGDNDGVRCNIMKVPFGFSGVKCMGWAIVAVFNTAANFTMDESGVLGIEPKRHEYAWG